MVFLAEVQFGIKAKVLSGKCFPIFGDKEMKKILYLFFPLLTCSCTTFGAHQMFGDSDRGFVMLAGDAEGIRAYNDGVNGIISNTKASKDVRTFRTPYYRGDHMRFRSYSQQQRSVSNDYNSNN